MRGFIEEVEIDDSRGEEHFTGVVRVMVDYRQHEDADAEAIEGRGVFMAAGATEPPDEDQDFTRAALPAWVVEQAENNVRERLNVLIEHDRDAAICAMAGV